MFCGYLKSIKSPGRSALILHLKLVVQFPTLPTLISSSASRRKFLHPLADPP